MKVRAVLSFLLVVAGPMAAQEAPPAAGPVVRAVLFYSPSCPHCRQVMTLDLPPLLERYGDALQIAAVNTATQGGQSLYLGTVRYLNVPPERLGVPTLVVGPRVLVGALEIPRDLPGIVERGLMGAGVDWPDVPVIQEALALEPAEPEPAAAAEPAETPVAEAGAGTPAEEVVAEPVDEATAVPEAPGNAVEEAEPARPVAEPADVAAAPAAATEPVAPAARRPTVAEVPSPVGDLAPTLEAEASFPTLTMADRFMLDPAGGTMSSVVLAFMLLVLVVSLAGVFLRVPLPATPAWTVPALAVAGIGVASYLGYVEVTGVEAVCGPVGDCNTVQQSEYAHLLGVPVGVLGILGYVAMGAAWLVGMPGRGTRPAAFAVTWVLALGATLFSMYLTFLEPFVIGATCVWCLSSAVITALILAAATPRAAPVLRPLAQGPRFVAS